MFTGNSAATSADGMPAPARRRTTHWLVWALVLVIVLVTAAITLIEPVARSVLNGIGSIAGGIAQAIGTAMQAPYDEACEWIENSFEAKSIFGEPVACAPIEQATWLESARGDELEFKIPLTGPQGIGEAHVVARATDDVFEVLRIHVTGPTAVSIELPGDAPR